MNRLTTSLPSPDCSSAKKSGRLRIRTCYVISMICLVKLKLYQSHIGQSQNSCGLNVMGVFHWSSLGSVAKVGGWGQKSPKRAKKNLGWFHLPNRT